MKDAEIIKELLKRNKIKREDVELFLKERYKNESILLFLVRKGILSEAEALELSQELLMSDEDSKDLMLDEGVLLEDRYLLYRVKDSTYAIPYSHIRTMELKGKSVILYTGGIERITIQLKDEESAKRLFEEILLGIERLYIR
ncbi:hypothetical protein [Hydrogenobacter hydrogenophilus]|uniref:Uncharacterized protein n=1 Tax=Hydrogenobacter hydrogenophilus TaxID=35835 RepID=A0A285NYQ4_9AQUI|nr:hypothetical protein [Hydrogenobacter hydrogenophilus]SNZ14622.1 hypothetical protein SAMN06265353_1146 [Hydrogenobacter hydrogenophilus]